MNNVVAPILQVEQIGKTFGLGRGKTLRALEDIDFTIAKGEFVSIVGQSGCGKSTLLRLISGLERPDSGKVILPQTGSSQPGIGFIFQNYNSFPWLTVEGNLRFALYRETDLIRRQKKIAEWLEQTKLTDFANSYPKNLSGGMQQRLAIARTMVTEPDVLLMDEPFGALDSKTRESMQRLLLDTVQRTGCSVLFVTHDLHEAISLSDRIFLMHARPGRISRTYTPVGDKTDKKERVLNLENMAIYNEILSFL